MRKWLAVILLTAGCASSGDDGTLVGRVRLMGTSGQPMGEASLFQVEGGIRIIANFPNLPEGDHGLHFHSVGECLPPTFESAGPHFNPTGRQHGRLNPNGPHLGDLPNVDRGRTMVNFVVPGLQMTGPNGLDDANGSSLILHANMDDQKTDPSGNSGARIRCGVVERP